jgi:hypothetical protein
MARFALSANRAFIFLERHAVPASLIVTSRDSHEQHCHGGQLEKAPGLIFSFPISSPVKATLPMENFGLQDETSSTNLRAKTTAAGPPLTPPLPHKGRGSSYGRASMSCLARGPNGGRDEVAVRLEKFDVANHVAGNQHIMESA